MSSLEVLHDTGRESTMLRFACATWGVFCLIASWFARANSAIGAIGAAFVGVAFLCVYFLRAKILFDRERRELIWISSFYGGRRTLLREAVGISSAVTGVITRSAKLYVHFSDGRRETIAHVAPRAAHDATHAISTAASIPVIEP